MDQHLDARHFVNKISSYFDPSFMLTRHCSQNSGQNCIGIEKLIVHVDQYDDLYDMLKERIEKLRCGSVTLPSDQGYLSPVDVGAMISDNRFDGLEALIKQAEEDGAKIVNGERYHHVYHDQGTYFLPTLVGLTKNSAAIAQQERKPICDFCHSCC